MSDRCLSWKRYLLEIVTRRTHRFLFGEAVYRLIAPSRALQGALIKEGLPAVHIPHFADTTSTDHQPLKREESTILFVGFLHFSKGISLLLEAFDDVRKEIPSARLVVTGDGPMEEELRSRHRMLNLGDSVRFLGPISEEEVKKSYRRSTFVVLPSIIYENSPLVIYEAMASGRAVVGTRIGGIPELVIDGETGLLFKRNDKSDLTAKMITLLKDKALADQMGRAGRRRAETEFTVEQHLDTVLHLYESAKRNFR